MEEIKQPAGLYTACFPESQAEAPADCPGYAAQTSSTKSETHHVDATDSETPQSRGAELFIHSSGLRRQHAQDKHTAQFLAGLTVNRRAANNNQSRSCTK